VRNPVAVSLALPDTASCLAALHRAAPFAGMAEVRLDAMRSCDLERLLAESPLPLVVTCRPVWEGGRFEGPEADRLELLVRAAELGCAGVDVEWEAAAALRARLRSATRLVVSRHWHSDPPRSLLAEYERLRPLADVVKLAVAATDPGQVLSVFELMARASSPLIAMAMGEGGRLTRILAPCFEGCLLTYGALEPRLATAPGQLTVAEMADDYGLGRVGPHTRIHLRFCANAAAARSLLARNRTAGGRDLHVPVVGVPDGWAELAAGLEHLLPRLDIGADAALALPFADAGIAVRS
jgi:3-dehydroquinate dehydratase type I